MSLSNYTAKELLAELERRGRVYETKPKPLVAPDWGSLHELVVKYIVDLELSLEGKHETSLEKWDHYIFEAAVEAVYGKAIWEWVNPILSGR